MTLSDISSGNEEMDDCGTSREGHDFETPSPDPSAIDPCEGPSSNERAPAVAPHTAALLSSIFRVAPAGIGLVADRVILEANERLCEMVGYAPEELIGQNARLLYPDQADYEYVGTEKYRQIAERGTGTVETRWRRKDGTIIDVLLSSTPLDLNDWSRGVTFTALDITSRKQAEEELRSIFDLSLDLVCIADINEGTFVKVNPAFERVLGYGLEDLEGRSFFDFVHPDDVARTRAVLEERLRQGQMVVNFENRYRCKDGSFRWLNWTSHPKPERGTSYAVARDVTESRKTREQIESLARFPSENPWPVLRITCTGMILYANPASTPLLDELDTGPGRRAPQPWCERVERVCASQTVERFEVEFREGTLAFQIVPVPDANHVNVYGTDVTLHKRAEEQLRRERDRSQMYLDVAGVLFVALDQKGRIRLINKKGCEILGYDENEILGTDWFIRFVPESRRREVWEIFDQLMRGQTRIAEYAETPVIVRDRSERIVAWHNTVLTDETGTIIGTLSSGEDITERRRTEERLREQRQNEKYRIEAELAKVRDELIRKTRLAALGQFSGSIAHDLRNPLGAVRNASYLLKRRIPKEQRALLEHVSIIEQEVIKADRIITSLLNITRARRPEKQPVDVGATARAAWSHGSYPERIRFRVELPEEPFVVQADRDQLSQVLCNLIGNAADAVGADGECVVEAIREPQHDIVIVRDTGPGWSPEVRDKLFEPLVTTKTSGTGLGLAICRQIIESHGGQIEALDADPQGAAVRIRLPRS